jgi:hypothetical protein
MAAGPIRHLSSSIPNRRDPIDNNPPGVLMKPAIPLAITKQERYAGLSPMPEFNHLMTVSQLIDIVHFLQSLF